MRENRHGSPVELEIGVFHEIDDVLHGDIKQTIVWEDSERVVTDVGQLGHGFLQENWRVLAGKRKAVSQHFMGSGKAGIRSR